MKSIHKCEYCETVINPCQIPCPERMEKSHVCCTCKEDSSEGCELPVRIVCSSSICNLKYTVDWYKIKLEEANGDIAKLKALTNQFRLANIGTAAAQKLIDEGTLDISGIKLFTAKQRLTWDMIPVETGYILMTLHEEFAKQWASFLNEKAVKVQLKKELIEQTEKKLKKAQAIREPTIKENKPKDEPGIRLTKLEKIIMERMKTFGWTQEQAEESLTSMGMVLEPKPRKIEVLNN